MQDGLAASRRLFIILDEKPKIISDNGKVECDFNNNNIELCGVHFSYKDGQKILDGINMHIPEGKTVALVGGSGVGKSTVLNLLQRLYDPDSGEIMIGGYNITDIKLKSLRKKMALVSQEVVLFDDTIAENIRYGRLNATDEEIVDAALAAAAHEFITSFPKGYETTIGESGVKLSGGQKQRIAIARAILKNAPILLLDEATSALDSISEKQVQMALEFLKKNRTTIVIAHRLSTIQSADIIYVISEGQILEHGTHQELLENGKEYQKLYEHYKESMNDGLQL